MYLATNLPKFVEIEVLMAVVMKQELNEFKYNMTSYQNTIRVVNYKGTMKMNAKVLIRS